jgi:hypothetical protein
MATVFHGGAEFVRLPWGSGVTGRAERLAALLVAAARRVEMLEAVIAAADAAAAAHPPNGARAFHLPRGARRAATRLRPRDTRRDDARRARAVALAGLERARRVEAAAAAELAGEGEAAA